MVQNIDYISKPKSLKSHKSAISSFEFGLCVCVCVCVYFCWHYISKPAAKNPEYFAHISRFGKCCLKKGH